jgi:integrase
MDERPIVACTRFMAQQVFTGKERIGRVTIERYQDKYIRLRWTLDGKTYSLNVGNDSAPTLKAARARARIIDGDITFNSFDKTLEKYGREAKPTVLKVIPTQLSLRTLWDRFLADKLPHIKQKTADEYQSFTKLLDKLGDRLSYNSLETKQALLTITTEDQARRMILYLSAACKWGCKHRLITENTFADVANDIPRRTAERHKADSFTEEEMMAVIEAFKSDKRAGKNYQPYAAIVEFWFRTGCRPSEAIGLTWENVAEDCKRIKFVGSIQQVNGKNVWSKGSKRNKTREFPCGGKLQELLLSIKPSNPSPDSLVFPAPQTEGAIYYDNFSRRAWSSIVDPIKPNTTPYNCRDTFITMQLMKGIAPAIIAAWCDTSVRMIESNYADAIKLARVVPLD